MAKNPRPPKGTWLRFAIREGLTIDAVLYWRRKAGVALPRSSHV